MWPYSSYGCLSTQALEHWHPFVINPEDNPHDNSHFGIKWFLDNVWCS